jgi:hypothetical protein
LACDSAVLRRHPLQRQAYANAILKTQLAASPRRAGAALFPIACHWQHHPLKERIMQIARPTPRRIQRRAMQALLLGSALLAGYGAWAAVADLDAVPLLRGKTSHAQPMATPQPAAAAMRTKANGQDCPNKLKTVQPESPLVIA